MRIWQRFSALMKVGLAVALCSVGLANASDMSKAVSWADAFISGTVSREEKRAIASQFLLIRELSRQPANLAQLVTKDLQFSGCNELITGSRRCTYWDPRFMNGRAMVLTDLNVDSVRRSADSGGTATWQVRDGVCVLPGLLVQLLNMSPRASPAQPGEPIAGILDEGDSTQYVFDEMNPASGHVSLSARAKNECVNWIEVQISK